jgi:proline iminopeptidase
MGDLLMAIDESYFYPEIDPYRTGKLSVSDIHSLYYELCGNRDGKAALFLHGGPGTGIAPLWRRLFDPKRYNIVLFDQRGCGKSEPYASLEENSTSYLINDIEKLRKHLSIEKWLLFGGSWGSTLALAYAQQFPERVSEMILYGIFLGSAREIAWFYQSGAKFILADAWERFADLVPPAKQDNLVQSYYDMLCSSDQALQLKAAKYWSELEGRGLCLKPDEDLISNFSEDKKALAQARIECHFFLNNCFLTDDFLLNGISKIRKIPGIIVHGRYDLICPFESAWKLHSAWPEAELVVVQDCGHSAREVGNQKALVAATNKFAGS